MIKRLIALLLATIMLVSLTACSSLEEKLEDFIAEYEDAMKEDDQGGEYNDEENLDEDEYDEDENDDEENLDEDEHDESENDGEEDIIASSNEAFTYEELSEIEEPKGKSVFNSKSFALEVSNDDGVWEYFATPMTYTVFDDENDAIETLSKLPKTVGPGEIVPLKAEAFGNPINTKLINFFYDKSQAGDEATLCYYELGVYEDYDYSFNDVHMKNFTKKEILNIYGEYDYEKVMSDKEIICYYVPASNLNNYLGFLELTFDKETQKLEMLKYGLFIPECLK